MPGKNMLNQLLFEYTPGNFYNDEVSPIVQATEDNTVPTSSWSLSALLGGSSSSRALKSPLLRAAQARPTRHQIAIDPNGKHIAILKSSTLVSLSTESKKEYMSDLPASAMEEARSREVKWCVRGKYILILSHSGSIDIFNAQCKYIGHVSNKTVAPAGVSVVGMYPCHTQVDDNTTWMLDVHCVLSNSTIVSIRTHSSSSGIQYQRMGISDAPSKIAEVLGTTGLHPFVGVLSTLSRSATIAIYEYSTPSSESILTHWAQCSSVTVQLHGAPVSLDINTSSACIAILYDTSRISIYKYDSAFTKCHSSIENETIPSHVTYSASNYISSMYFLDESYLWTMSASGEIAIAEFDIASLHLSTASVDAVPPPLGPSASCHARNGGRIAILRAVDAYASQVFLVTKTTPQHAIERNIRNGRFEAAYDMAQRFSYDLDDVKKGEWKYGARYGISLERRLALLRDVDSSWALQEIATYHDHNITSWRSILMLGLELTESILPSLIDSHLHFEDWTEVMVSDVEFRHTFVSRLLRLDTYADLSQSGFTAEDAAGSKFNGDLLHWVVHSSLKIVACVVANKGKVETLRRLMLRHRFELYEQWMDILLCIPESIAPDSYCALFPRNCEAAPAGRYLCCYYDEIHVDDTPTYAKDAALSIVAHYLLSSDKYTANACEAYACAVSSQYSFDSLYRWYIDRAMHFEALGQSLHSFQILCHATAKLFPCENSDYDYKLKFLRELRTHIYHFSMMMYSNLIHVSSPFQQFYHVHQRDHLVYAAKAIISADTHTNFIGLFRHYIRPMLELENALYQEITPGIFKEMLSRYCNVRHIWNVETLESDVVEALVHAVVPGNLDILEMICGVAEGSKPTIPAAHRCIDSIDLLNDLVVRSCLKYNDIQSGLSVMWRMLECTGSKGTEENVLILDAIQNVLSAAEVIKDYIPIPPMHALLSLSPNYRYNARKVMLGLLKGKGEYALGLEKYMSDGSSVATEEYCVHRSKRSKSNEYLRELQFNMKLEHAIVIHMCWSQRHTNNMSCWVQLANDIIQLKKFIYPQLSLEWCFCAVLQMLLNHQQQLFKQTAQNLISNKLPPQAISYLFHANGITEAHVVDIALRKSREAFNAASSIYDENINEAKAYLLYIEHCSPSVSRELVTEWAIHGVLDFLIDVDIDMVPLQLRLLSSVEICHRVLEARPLAYKCRNCEDIMTFAGDDDYVSTFLFSSCEYESEKFVALLSSLDERKLPSIVLQLHVEVVRAAMLSRQFMDAALHCHRIMQLLEDTSTSDSCIFMQVVRTTLHDIIHWDSDNERNVRVAQYLASKYMIVSTDSDIVACLDILDLIPKTLEIKGDDALLSAARNQLLSLVGDILYNQSDPLRLSQPQNEVGDIIKALALQNRMNDIVGYLRMVRNKTNIDALFAQLLKDLKKKVTTSSNSSRANSSFSHVADEYLVSQIQTMGFSRQGSIRSVLATHNSTMENALRWAIDHSNDADFDDPVVQSASGLLLKSDLQPVVSIKDLHRAIEIVKSLSNVIHNKQDESSKKASVAVQKLQKDDATSGVQTEIPPSLLTDADLSKGLSVVTPNIDETNDFNSSATKLHVAVLKRDDETPLRIPKKDAQEESMPSPSCSVDISVMHGFGNDNSVYLTLATPSVTPHQQDNVVVTDAEENDMPKQSDFPMENIATSSNDDTVLVASSEHGTSTTIFDQERHISTTSDDENEVMVQNPQECENSDDDLVIVEHTEKSSENGSVDMSNFGDIPSKVVDEHTSFIDSMVPGNSITPLLADDATEEESAAADAHFCDDEKNPVLSHLAVEKSSSYGKLPTETQDSQANDTEEFVENADETTHKVHFSAAVIDHQQYQAQSEEDPYTELSQAASEVAKLELALHIAIEKLHLPYDEVNLARNAVLFVEDFAVDHELVPLINDVVTSAIVQNFELLVNIIHVLPRHVIDHLHENEFQLPNFSTLPLYSKADFLKAFESLSLRSHRTKLHDLQWTLAYNVLKSVVICRKSDNSRKWKDVESSLVESKALIVLRERPYQYFSWIREMFTMVNGDELSVLEFLKSLCMDLLLKYNENQEFDSEIKQLNEDIATYKRIGRVPDSVGINVRVVLQQDDILSASFFSNSPRRAHERVKSLLELARFLIPATVQAWNRALGRVLEIGPSEMGFYCILSMLCSLQDILSEDNSAVLSTFLAEITPLLGKIRQNYIIALLYVIASVPLRYIDLGEDDDENIDFFPLPLQHAPSSATSELLALILQAMSSEANKKPKTKSILAKSGSGTESDDHEELITLVKSLRAFCKACDWMSNDLKVLYRAGFRNTNSLTQCIERALKSPNVTKEQFCQLLECVENRVAALGISLDRMSISCQACDVLFEPTLNNCVELFCEKLNAFLDATDTGVFWSDFFPVHVTSLSSGRNGVVETLQYRANVLERIALIAPVTGAAEIIKCLRVNRVLFEFFPNASLSASSNNDYGFIVSMTSMQDELCLNDVLTAAIGSVETYDDTTANALIAISRMWHNLSADPHSYLLLAHEESVAVGNVLPYNICKELLCICVKCSAWCSFMDVLLVDMENHSNKSEIFDHINTLLNSSDCPHKNTIHAVADIMFNNGTNICPLVEAAKVGHLKPLIVLITMKYLCPNQFVRTPLLSLVTTVSLEWMKLRIFNESSNRETSSYVMKSLQRCFETINEGSHLPYILSPQYIAKVLYANRFYTEAAHLFWNASMLPSSMYSTSTALKLVRKYSEDGNLPLCIRRIPEIADR